MADTPWYQTVSIPALLRHARTAYGAAMRRALEAAGYDDIPANGLYVIGGLAQDQRDKALAQIIDDLGLSKQAAGHLVDTLAARGYLERRVDPRDRRRLVILLTARGQDAAHVQTAARAAVDQALAERVGEDGVLALRKALAALAALRSQPLKPVEKDDDAD